MNRKYWTKEDTETLITMRQDGITYEEIAEILGRTTASVLMKGSRLIAAGENIKEKNIIKWSEEEDSKLAFLYSQKYSLEEIAVELGRTYTAIRKRLIVLRANNRFGLSTKKFNKEVPTRLYLINFEDRFYKVGITTKSVKERAKVYNRVRHTIIDELEYDTWDEAKDCEQELLNKVQRYKYTPNEPALQRDGKTECFIPPHPINALEEIFDL